MRTMNSFLVIAFIIICYVQLVNCDVCSCSCCKGEPCTLKYQGYFPLNPCTSYNCMVQCRVKFSNCPPDESDGHTQGQCKPDPPSYASHQTGNMVLIILFIFVINLCL